jgi:predicted ArsR family transcriptional regulator
MQRGRTTLFWRLTSGRSEEEGKREREGGGRMLGMLGMLRVSENEEKRD